MFIPKFILPNHSPPTKYGNDLIAEIFFRPNDTPRADRVRRSGRKKKRVRFETYRIKTDANEPTGRRCLSFIIIIIIIIYWVLLLLL